MIIGIPTLNRYDMLARLITSIEKQTAQPERLIVIDNGSGLASDRENVEIVDFGKNIGVPASWNYILHQVPSDGLWLICNDDIDFPDSTTIAQFIAAGTNVPLAMYTSYSIIGGNAYSCFMLSQEVVSMVGYFDEEFWPAYFEDNDYDYRRRLCGLEFIPLKVPVEHARSTTFNAFTPEQKIEHHPRFNKNHNYYRRKWGGSPGQESFLRPFGG